MIRPRRPGELRQMVRRRSGFRQRDIARRLHVSEAFVSMIFTGARQCPLKFAMELEKLTGVPAREFIVSPHVPLAAPPRIHW